jgi:hypothetical protein
VLDVSEHLGDQPEHGNRRLAAAVHDRDQRAERVDLDERILRRAAGAARLVAAHGVPHRRDFKESFNKTNQRWPTTAASAEHRAVSYWLAGRGWPLEPAMPSHRII